MSRSPTPVSRGFILLHEAVVMLYVVSRKLYASTR